MTKNYNLDSYNRNSKMASKTHQTDNLTKFKAFCHFWDIFRNLPKRSKLSTNTFAMNQMFLLVGLEVEGSRV